MFEIGKGFGFLLLVFIGIILYFGYKIGSKKTIESKKIIIPKTEIIIKNGKADTTYIYQF